MDRQPGSYIKEKNKLMPNLNDEAMKIREENKKIKEEIKDAKRKNPDTGKD